jgi:flagellar hook-length control protein FliK
MTLNMPTAATDINAVTANASGTQASDSASVLGDTGQFAQLLAGETSAVPLAGMLEESGQDVREAERDAAAAEYSPEGWLELLAVALGAPTSPSGATRMAAGGIAGADGGEASVAGATAGAGGVVTPDEQGGAPHADALAPRADRPMSLPPLLASSAPTPMQLTGEAALRALNLEGADTAADRSQDLGSSLVATRSNSQPALHSLSHPVGTPAWQTELATRVVYLVRGAEQSATLNLNPVDLGPVEVRIQIKEGDASVVFTAAQPEARAALELALPRLRELFAAQGLALSESTVLADQGAAANHSQPDSERSHPRNSRANAERRDELAVTSITVSSRSLIDLYA